MAATRHDLGPHPSTLDAGPASSSTGQPMKRVGWGRVALDEACREIADLCGPLMCRAKTWRARASRRIEVALLGWIVDAEPAAGPDQRLLAEDDDGNIVVFARFRDGEPWWEGRWRWWRPGHWPVYVRSRRARSYVLVERG